MPFSLSELQNQLNAENPKFQENCKAYLSLGGNINVVSSECNLSLLELACMSKNPETTFAVNTIDFLIKNKADICCGYKENYPGSLETAAAHAKNPVPIVQCLLKHKADAAAGGETLYNKIAPFQPMLLEKGHQCSNPLPLLLAAGARPSKP